MNKLTLSIAMLAALALVGFDTKTAEAAHGFGGFGLHFSGRNVHFNVGNPHGYRNHVAYRTARTYRPQYQARSRYVWHDTSHYDYHPSRCVRHGNHFDYVPGHYAWHQEGHYDRHDRGRHGGHH